MPSGLIPRILNGSIYLLLVLTLAACGAAPSQGVTDTEGSAQTAETSASASAEKSDASKEKKAESEKSTEESSKSAEKETKTDQTSQSTPAAWQSAYASVLDMAESYDYGIDYSRTGTYRYALVEMSGDDVPELVLGADMAQGARGAQETWFKVFSCDAAGSLQEIEGALQWGSPFGLGEASDGRGLIQSYQERGNVMSKRVLVSGGQLVFEDVTSVEARDLALHDRSDRGVLSQASGAATSSSLETQSQQQAAVSHDFECDYFYVDVPPSWAGQWTVQQESPTSWRFGQSATEVRSPDGDVYGGGGAMVSVGGNPPHTAVIGMLDSGQTVYENEAGAGFFGSGMASITLKSCGGAASQQATSGDYVLADSASRFYTYAELERLDNYTLYLARNEIYARHGRRFKRQDLQAYFNGKSWYSGTIAPESFNEGVFNDMERSNADLMLSIERSRNSPYL